MIGQIVDIKRDLTGHALVHCFGLQRVKIENSVPNRPVLTVKVKLVQNKMPHPKRSEYIKAYVHEILKVRVNHTLPSRPVPISRMLKISPNKHKDQFILVVDR